MQARVFRAGSPYPPSRYIINSSSAGMETCPTKLGVVLCHRGGITLSPSKDSRLDKSIEHSPDTQCRRNMDISRRSLPHTCACYSLLPHSKDIYPVATEFYLLVLPNLYPYWPRPVFLSRCPCIDDLPGYSFTTLILGCVLAVLIKKHQPSDRSEEEPKKEPQPWIAVRCLSPICAEYSKKKKY